MLERILEESPDKYLILIKNAEEYISKKKISTNRGTIN